MSFSATPVSDQSFTNPVAIIETKRDGGSLTDEQIRWFIARYATGDIAEEQAAALCMAIYFRDLDERELSTWTASMVESGSRLDLSSVDRPTVDKHSTGGVGDKVSLILCPLMAACGAAVPQLSGRGLGHTGGTLDKLEAIPGWSGDLSSDSFIDQLERVGTAIVSAGPDLAPADRKLYALRDITATVPSIPLIASSIMSKKIAEGTDALVLDIKFGSGAFIEDPTRGRELASRMVALGAAHGIGTSALLTDMDQPLGRSAGNANEVAESVEVLAGGGPADLVEVTLALAEEMCTLAGIDADPAAVLASGSAMDKWRAMVTAQGGNPDAPLPTAAAVEQVTGRTAGIVQRIDARMVGDAARILGAGRIQPGEAVSAGAGVDIERIAGDAVAEGDTVFTIRTDDEASIEPARTLLSTAVEIADTAPPPRTLVLDRIPAAG